MLRAIISFFILSSCMFGTTIVLPKNQILVTDKGIFFELNDALFVSPHLIYVGNGLYEVNLYGSCGKCGVPLDEDGNCSNRDCLQCRADRYG